MRQCAKCGVYACREGEKDKLPDDCPMKMHSEVYEEVAGIYDDHKETCHLAVNSALTESTGYGNWTRLEEVMEFSKKMGYRKLGIAFCFGLRNETREIVKVLSENGFEVYSVVCKTGSLPKEHVGIKDEQKVRPGHFEALCNPVAQAKILNKMKTDFNVLVGLCVGHDTLFIKYSEAPVTNLVAKDRALAHNPLGAVYATHYFNKRLRNHKIDD